MASFELMPSGRGGEAPVPFAGPPAGWTPEPGSSPEETIHLRDILGVLRRHVVVVLGIAAVVFAAAVYLVLTQAPEYRARAVLRLQDERGAMTGGIGGAAMEEMMGKTNDPLLSELEVLRSRAVALEVLRSTPVRLVSEERAFRVGDLRDVSVDPEALADTLTLRFGAQGFTVQGGAGEVEGQYGVPVQLAGLSFTLPARPEVDGARMILLEREDAIERLREGMTARPREKTDVVDVEFTSTDPRLAQQVVNATVEAFSERNTQVAQESSRRRRIFLGEQLQETDSMLAGAQLALSDFRRREAVYSSREKFAAQQTGLMGLDVRREELDADRRMFQSLLEGLQRSERGRGLETLVSAPGIASNPVIAQLYTQLVQYQTSRDSLTTGAWGSAATNPDVQRLNALVASTEVKLIDAVRSHVDAVDARIAALDGLRASNEAELQALPEAEAEEMRLVQQVETVGKMADQLREEYQKARIAEAVEVGQVTIVDMAALPAEPIGSGRSLKLALGLVLGLMLGSGGAFLREHMNTSIRRREEIEEVLRVPGLAVIPQIFAPRNGARWMHLPASIRGNGNGHGAGPNELVTVSDGLSSGAEAFRLLRTNLIFSQSVHSLRSIVITSTTPGDGKTTTAANLAVSYAQQGLRVLLVDCDLRRSRMHKVFRVPQDPGLTELVLGHLAPGETIRNTDVPNLSLLPAGTRPPNPAELLGGPRMEKVLEALGKGFDLIILDTPPLMAAADAAILGAKADGVLMVVRAGQTERAAAQQAMQQLANVGARVVGAVLNDPDAEIRKYGGYYYYGYYGEDAKAAV